MCPSLIMASSSHRNTGTAFQQVQQTRCGARCKVCPVLVTSWMAQPSERVDMPTGSARSQSARVWCKTSVEVSNDVAGALVRHGGAFHRVADPLRHLLDGVLSLGNPVGSPVDKARVGLLRAKTLTRSVDATLAAPETSTLRRLQARASSCCVALEEIVHAHSPSTRSDDETRSAWEASQTSHGAACSR